MKRDKIIELIKEERQYQILKWGGKPHDCQVGMVYWIVYITKFVGKLSTGFMNQDYDEIKRQLIKVAALCFAALENHPQFEEN